MCISSGPRYGFSLRDGAPFDPAFSDLDLAVVDPHLYHRCAATEYAPPYAPRFPEKDLPAGDRVAVRMAFDALSRSAADQFAYVSVAVFPDHAALIRAQSGRIRAYLGIPAPSPTQVTTNAGTAVSADLHFQIIVDAGLPAHMLPLATSTPANASPWLADIVSFHHAFGGSAIRQSRLDSLQQAFGDLSQVVDVQCCLVDGSFVDTSNPAPNDLDIVVFYRA